jgi:hypothetical protein
MEIISIDNVLSNVCHKCGDSLEKKEYEELGSHDIFSLKYGEEDPRGYLHSLGEHDGVSPDLPYVGVFGETTWETEAIEDINKEFKLKNTLDRKRFCKKCFDSSKHLGIPSMWGKTLKRKDKDIEQARRTIRLLRKTKLRNDLHKEITISDELKSVMFPKDNSFYNSIKYTDYFYSSEIPSDCSNKIEWNEEKYQSFISNRYEFKNKKQ